jgi:tetratricopeptide (TPR) repeat protein
VIAESQALAAVLTDRYAYLHFASAGARYLNASNKDILRRAENAIDAVAVDAPRLEHLLGPLRALDIAAACQVDLPTLLGSDLFARAETGDPDARAEAMLMMAKALELQLDPQRAQDILMKTTLMQAAMREEDPPDPVPTAPVAVDASAASGGDGERAALERELRKGDEAGTGAAASDLGVLLDKRGDVAGAHAAYRRADERGHAIGSFNLGDLLMRLRKFNEAEAAYGRADQRGHARGAYNLGVLLEGRGESRAAEDAYWRAIERGYHHAALNLSGLLAERAEGRQELQEAVRRGRPGADLVMAHFRMRRGTLAGGSGRGCRPFRTGGGATG